MTLSRSHIQRKRLELGLGPKFNQFNHRGRLSFQDPFLPPSLPSAFLSSFPPRNQSLPEQHIEAGTCESDLLPNILCILGRKIIGPGKKRLKGKEVGESGNVSI